MKLNYTKTRLRSVQHKRNSKTRSRGKMPSACIGPRCSQQGLSVAKFVKNRPKTDILPIRFPPSPSVSKHNSAVSRNPFNTVFFRLSEPQRSLNFQYFRCSAYSGVAFI